MLNPFYIPLCGSFAAGFFFFFFGWDGDGEGGSKHSGRRFIGQLSDFQPMKA